MMSVLTTDHSALQRKQSSLTANYSYVCVTVHLYRRYNDSYLTIFYNAKVIFPALVYAYHKYTRK